MYTQYHIVLQVRNDIGTSSFFSVRVGGRARAVKRRHRHRRGVPPTQTVTATIAYSRADPARACNRSGGERPLRCRVAVPQYEYNIIVVSGNVTVRARRSLSRIRRYTGNNRVTIRRNTRRTRYCRTRRIDCIKRLLIIITIIIVIAIILAGRFVALRPCSGEQPVFDACRADARFRGRRRQLQCSQRYELNVVGWP